MKDQKTQAGLQPYLSPAAAWALAVGTSVGWGSLVVTANTYLAQAGPLGSILGLLVGMALMLVISRNFFYMASRYPLAEASMSTRGRSSAMTALFWSSGFSV